MAGSYLPPDLTSEDIDDFFRIKPKQKLKAGSLVSRSSRREDPGVTLVHSDAKLNKNDNTLPQGYVPPYKRHPHNSVNQTAYAAHYQQEEDEMLTRQVSSLQLPDDSLTVNSLQPKGPAAPVRGGMEDIDMSSMADSAPCMVEPREDDNVVYSNYNMHHQYDEKLPITECREEIINTIEANQVTVIEGATGSGKTTQVPQYILDHCASQNKYCSIVVTQPRRIAAVSIAKRVCSERNWDLRGICGYQIGMDRQASEDTRLLYVTTQVLLRQLISAKSMQQYTHVILDEVHERDQHSDFCLLVVRKLLRTNSRDVKVILMSATIEASRFADYFKVPVRGVMEPAPVLTVGATSTYNVSEYFADDLTILGDVPLLEVDRPGIDLRAYEMARELIVKFDDMEIKQQGESPNGFAKSRGSVLVFLPGLREIMDMHDMLDKIKQKCGLEVIPLHSSITAEEQILVFERFPPQKRKVILSTNIAESSITVSDIRYVVDFCLTKNMVCDSEMYTSLTVEWTSKANCVQRKGRAGRVANGRVYRMVTRKFYTEVLPDYGTPEMQRCPLEHLILQVKLLDLGEPKRILGLALSPPNLDDIERTILTLKEACALTTPPGELYNPHDGHLTFMGRVLAELPVDIHYGKLMLLGHVFGCLESCIIIAAMLSLKSVFQRPFKAELDAYKMKLTWASDKQSDSIAMLNVYRMWEKKTALHAFQSRRGEREWGYEHMVQVNRLYDVRELVRELTMRLQEYKIKPPTGPQPQLQSAHETLILQVVMVGAFYPNYFIRRHNEDTEVDANRALSGRNHYTTVMVKGLPQNEGTLYRSAIQHLFRPCHSNPRIHFEETKAFVEFPRDPTQRAKQFSPAVYHALKMKQLRIPLTVLLLDREEAFQRKLEMSQSQDQIAANQRHLRTNRITMDGDLSDNSQNTHQVDLPASDQTIIHLNITEVVECGRFWAHYADDETETELLNLQQDINLYQGQNLKPMQKPTVGALCLCPFEDEYYRAQVIHVNAGHTKIPMVRVFFVDYGNVADIHLGAVRQIEPHQRSLKYQSFECEIKGIRPSPVRCPTGIWTEEAKREFTRVIGTGEKAFGHVYSVVHGVVRLDVQLQVGYSRSVNLGQYLTEQGFAEENEESYISKQNHAHRQSAAARVHNTSSEYSASIHSVSTVSSLRPVPTSLDTPPQFDANKHSTHKYGTQRITLIGPTSPFQMEFDGMTAISKFKEINIDHDSVNSVVLDDKPENSHDRMLVAASVMVTASGDKIKLRDTSLLPHIAGLPALLTLLFTPQAELRTDSRQTRYTGAICGLGWDSFNQGPALPDHDIELAFDTHIDMNDIKDINRVRIAINNVIGSSNDEGFQYWGPNSIIKIQQRARSVLIELLQKKRRAMDKAFIRRANEWNLVKAEDLLLAEDKSQNEDRLYNLHPLVALAESEMCETYTSAQEEKAMEKLKMCQHIDYLRAMVERESFSEPVVCYLCKYTAAKPQNLKIHLATLMHRQQEIEYL